MNEKLKDEVTITRSEFCKILSETIMSDVKEDGLDGEMKFVTSLMAMKFGIELEKRIFGEEE